MGESEGKSETVLNPSTASDIDALYRNLMYGKKESSRKNDPFIKAPMDFVIRRRDSCSFSFSLSHIFALRVYMKSTK